MHSAVGEADWEDAFSFFKCPITLEYMEDPVIGSDHFTYERSAILIALAVAPVSPMTREAMGPADLRPNRALREAIQFHRLRDQAPPRNNNRGDAPRSRNGFVLEDLKASQLINLIVSVGGINEVPKGVRDKDELIRKARMLLQRPPLS